MKRLAEVLFAIVVASANCGVAFAQFTNVTTGDMAAARDDYGCAWGDFDNDGDEDVFIPSRTLPSLLYRNDGGAFTNVTPLSMSGLTLASGAAWADIDNDGDLDLAVARDGQNRLYRNDGSTTFVDVTSAPLLTTQWAHTMSWGDFDNDGLVDLYLTNRTTDLNKLLRNLGASIFIDVTSPVVNGANDCIGVAACDFDNDNDLDIFYTDLGAGPAVLAQNDGSFVFSDVAPTALATQSSSSEGATWGDYDNDGDFDLCYARGSGLFHQRLLRNDGAGVFTDQTAGPLLVVKHVRGVSWGDYDNDGDLDLATCGDNDHRILRNDGGVLVDATPASVIHNGIGHGLAWADCDGDGDLDIFFANHSQSRLYRNDLANGNHWLHVRLIGLSSNGASIGARVKVVAAGSSQIREVEGGGIYASQNSLPVEFGLAATSQVDSLIVTWPSGITSRVLCPPIDTLLTVSEPALPDTVSHCVLCACLCHGDPQCDDVIADVLDVVSTINVAFRGSAAIIDPSATCPWQSTDVDCSGATDVLDVVKTVNVAFRGANAVTEYCDPCL